MFIYRYSEFQPKQYGNGAEKRSFQIVDFFKRNNIELKDISFMQKNMPKLDIKNKIKYLILAYVFVLKYNLHIKHFRTYKGIAIRLYAIKTFLKNFDRENIVIYEHSVISDWLFPVVAKEHGHKIICFPHNLESLIQGQHALISDQKDLNGFLNEVKVFRSCDVVLTISKEEEWLLNLLNMNTIYFPYVPSDSEVKKLEEVSIKRKVRQHRNHFLILGSYGNPPTRLGMIQLLSETIKEKYNIFNFHVAGFNMDNLANELSLPKNHEIHSSISAEELYNLFVLVDAIIIFQIPSTGALTKIPELLIAGVPIIMNRNAARNYFNVPGVRIYNELPELNNILINWEKEKTVINYKGDFEQDDVYITKIFSALRN